MCATGSNRYAGINEKFTVVGYALDRSDQERPEMTLKQAFRMGFRHIADLAEINQIADRLLEDEFDSRAQRLIEAWRQGAMTATAMLEKEEATIQ
jgi:hypothetical protein